MLCGLGGLAGSNPLSGIPPMSRGPPFPYPPEPLNFGRKGPPLGVPATGAVPTMPAGKILFIYHLPISHLFTVNATVKPVFSGRGFVLWSVGRSVHPFILPSMTRFAFIL